MSRIKIHISKVKLPFFPLGEVKYRLQNEVSTPSPRFGFVSLSSVLIPIIL